MTYTTGEVDVHGEDTDILGAGEVSVNGRCGQWDGHFGQEGISVDGGSRE